MRLRERLRALERAVRDHHLADADRCQLPRDLGRRLARADQQHAAIAQREAVLELIDRGRCDGHRAGADGGRRARAAAGANRRGEHAAQERARAGGLLHRRAHLAENFGLAQHHRFEAAAHAEEVTRRIIAGDLNRAAVQQILRERQRRFEDRRPRFDHHRRRAPRQYTSKRLQVESTIDSIPAVVSDA